MSELVFDIGMHNGDDTAYYLARGEPSGSNRGKPRYVRHGSKALCS